MSARILLYSETIPISLCELRVSRKVLANLTVGICSVLASVWCEDTLGARVLGDVLSEMQGI